MVRGPTCGSSDPHIRFQNGGLVAWRAIRELVSPEASPGVSTSTVLCQARRELSPTRCAPCFIACSGDGRAGSGLSCTQVLRAWSTCSSCGQSCGRGSRGLGSETSGMCNRGQLTLDVGDSYIHRCSGAAMFEPCGCGA